MHTNPLKSQDNRAIINKTLIVEKSEYPSQGHTGPLKWWYYLTLPASLSANASLEQRERARRGKLTSAILLIVLILLLAAIPVAFSGTNPFLIVIFIIPLAIDFSALALNRWGQFTLAAVMIVVGIDVGIGLSIVTVPGGFSTYTLPLFDLLVQAEFVAVSLLPTRSVFLVALIHSIFIWASITFLPHTPEFSVMIAKNGYEVFLRPISLQIIVATVTYLWVTSAQQAIARADRAEEISELEKREISRQQQELEQKQQLEMGIQQILHTHTQIANGDFSVRAPLAQDNILWRISYSLNNLLARLQRLSMVENELQRIRIENIRLTEALREVNTVQYELRRTKGENVRLTEALREASTAQAELERTKEAVEHFIGAAQRAKHSQQTLPVARTGTIIDDLVVHLMAR